MLISGRGSNLGALLELREEIDLRLVISSSARAYGLVRARRAGLPAELAPTVSGTRKIDWAALSQRLLSGGITHVFLAGFMKVVPREFVEAWAGRLVNLHPSLLPSYPGLKSIERAYTDGAALGVTVHEVTEEVDAGAVILQRRSLNADEIRSYSPRSAEFLVHVDEQRAVKEAVRRWKHQRI